MIVRDDGDSLLLITQPDHARLAQELVAAIRTEPALLTGARSAILVATREHDNGWLELDAQPSIEEATGRPVDFTNGSMAVKRELWPRGITRATRHNPRVGALVAEHALTVYGYRRTEPEWASFFETVTSMRDDLLTKIGATEGPARQTFQTEYRPVRLGDSFSLQFCSGWTVPHDTLDYRAVMDGWTLRITPDPFGGGAVPLRITGRRIPARRYQDDADLQATLASASSEVLVGEARGG